jgi:hypothetical protein
MRASKIFAALALSAISSAIPSSLRTKGQESCLDENAASYLVNSFADLLTNTGANFNTALANAILADDFTDTSDSINFLAGIPEGSVTFPSKAAFIAGQGSQPPIGFTVLSIDAVTCNTIAFRWIATVGLMKSPVKGIDIFYTSNSEGRYDTFQIESIFSEFNSAAWVLDIGGTCVP